MNLKRLASGSFWLIMLIHILVFTSIGLFTSKGWGSLKLFLSLFIPLLCVLGVLTLYSKRYCGKQRFATFLSMVLNKKDE